MLQNVNEVSGVVALKAPQFDVITESLHVMLRVNNAMKCLTNDSYISSDCCMSVTCQSIIASA
jgi:hypothetical protein